MNKVASILLTACVACAPAMVQAQQPAAPAATQSKVLSITGGGVGTARFTQTPEGVRIEAEVTGLTPGEHAVHIHETGSCNPASYFNSAGRHLGADLAQHGTAAPGGPHLGDLPNQTAGADGRMRIDVVAAKVTLQATGPGALLDEDESALVVHAKPDDNRTQPSGGSGDRVACALITRTPPVGGA